MKVYLYKRKNIWHARFKYKGRRITRSLHTSIYKLALKVVAILEEKIVLGTFQPDNQEEIILSSFFTKYFETATIGQSPKTIKNTKNVAQQLIRIIGDVPLSDITIRILDQWKAKIISEKSPTTFNIHYRFLHAAFNRAIRWGYLTKNPFASITKMKIDEHRLYLTKEETRQVFNAIDQDILQLQSRKRKTKIPLFKKCAVFLLNTGLRIGEACKLQMKDVDFSSKVIHIEKTKTHLSRIVPLTPEALEILRNLDESLFQNLTESYVSQYFGYYLKEAGLIGFKQHSLRHTFATRLVECGVDLFIISKILGHTSMKTTMIYAKAGVNTLRSAIGQLDLGLASIQIGDTVDRKEENTVIKQGD